MASDDFAAKLDTLHSLDDVRAVAPGNEVATEDRCEVATIAAQEGVDPEDAKAFENAGWTFVKAGETAGDEAKHEVVVDGDGHLKISSNALNVKFAPALERRMVEKILGKYDLSIRRDMGFSPNLFLVTGAAGDAVGKAKSLNKLDSVVYAEPVLIEAIKGR
jgi:hypothetical protein